MSQARADTLVVIPTFNERENIERIVPAVLAAHPADLLVVDDESPDGTGDLAAALAGRYPRVEVLHRAGKPRGFGPSYIDGFSEALRRGYAYVVQMDADFQHDPEMVPVLRRAAESADLVIGSRYVKGGGAGGWSWHRRVLSQGGSFYARKVLGLPVHDLTSGFKCWRAEGLRAVKFETVASTGFAFQIEMNFRAVRAGLHVLEVPIQFIDRSLGTSKMSFGTMVEGLSSVWRIRRKGFSGR
jgi:dolichol-phosphate mannosyltransferase